MATHSPHPSASGVTTLTSRTSRAVSVPNDVRNGDTSGIAIRRSSTPVIFTLSPLGRRTGVPWRPYDMRPRRDSYRDTKGRHFFVGRSYTTMPGVGAIRIRHGVSSLSRTASSGTVTSGVR
ncbi:hypothetical protein GCM10010176_002540 [Nonomuraea spiralis]|nr:hypothetical protein GCM10010176_002540 [Nonomuraea spiralis]